MKKHIILLTIMLLIASPVIYSNWPQQSPEQIERANISIEIARIKEQFTAMGAGRSGAKYAAIVQYLKSVGTPVSHKIYQEMKDSGELPKNA